MGIKPFLIVLVCVISENDSANILGVFPTPSFSHQIVFRKITQELVSRGHDVTVITTDPAYPKGSAPHNYHEIDVHNISYSMIRQSSINPFNVTGKVLSFKDIRDLSLLLQYLMKIQIGTKEVQELVTSDKKFDLILIESIVRPALVFSHIFKAPVILVSSFTAVLSNNKVVGSPTHPFLYPGPFRHRIYNLSLTEKFIELYSHYSTEYADYLNEQDENQFLKETFGPQCPTVHELSNNVEMLFLNIHSIWADNQPVAPNVVYMGGIHQLPEKQLPKDLQNYLDSSNNGVIYISFGTNALSNMIPEEKVNAIINVLSKLPYNILWKWDDELPRTSSNIKTSKWLPQSDLLRHPNIKLFITQAGLQSTDEAITAGVPLVAIPMLGDQWYNAEKYEKYGIGVQLDIKFLTEDQLENAIRTVIENDSYRRNINKLRVIMCDRPDTPLNQTMWWIEYVLRHQGAKHLRAPASNMSYVEYFEVEVLLCIVLIIIVILFAIVFLLKKCLQFIITIPKSKKLKTH